MNYGSISWNNDKIMLYFLENVTAVSDHIHNFLRYIRDHRWILPDINPLINNPTKWSNTLKLFVGKLPTNCLKVFDHFVDLVLKGLSRFKWINYNFYSPWNHQKTIGQISLIWGGKFWRRCLTISDRASLSYYLSIHM